ncbi:apolipoprotein N-acyltransferase [Allohahella marinimesophila]|uniref:Apolipoprotein N-acyltransferase n=1 Tax=Allohahella marinimesophila TaxID=1054972 RepID=A0ABP7NZP2_9GAMM
MSELLTRPPSLPAGVLALSSGILLALPLLYPTLFFLMWFAFVPLLLVIGRSTLLQCYVFGMLAGLVFSMGVSYWIIDFIMLSKGYGVFQSLAWACLFWLYGAQLPAFIMLLFGWLRQRTRLHDLLLFPVVAATLCAVFPMLFPVRLGESQSGFIIALQATALVGVSGLDFIIAIVNCMLFRCLIREHRSWLMLPAAALVLLWFAYGWHAMLKWDDVLAQQQTVRFGLVQPNEKPTLEAPPIYAGYSRAFPPELEMTQRLAAAGADIVVWPEARHKGYFDMAAVQAAFADTVDELDVKLVFQDIETRPSVDEQAVSVQFNTAVMIDAQGEEVGRYRKVMRIPFGEYVPLVSNVPFVKAQAEQFLGAFLNEIAAGDAHEVFTDDEVQLVPLICYETVFPAFAAKAVATAGEGPGGLLLALSSNGWFGATHQPYQHVHSAILRAVENRLPMVHVVNNGPSVVVLPNGRVLFKSPSQQAGGWLVDVPIAEQFEPAPFTLYPNVFTGGLLTCLFLFMLVATFLPLLSDRFAGRQAEIRYRQ